MDRIAFDTETWPIEPGRAIPPLVCLSVSVDVKHAAVIHRRDPACFSMVCEMIDRARAGTAQLVGFQIAYDLAVIGNTWPELLPYIFEVYERDAIYDVMIAQKLLDIAHDEFRWLILPDGTKEKMLYNLAQTAKKYEYPIDLDKDTWRLRYREFDEIPVADWPEGAREYPEHDARSTLWCAERQPDHATLVDLPRQCRGAFALELMSAHGIRTSRIMVERQRKIVQARIDRMKEELLAAKLIERKKDGEYKRCQKYALEYARKAWEEIGIPPETTDTGRVSLSKDACAQLGDELLIGYADFGAGNTMMSHVEEVARGVEYPIHTHFGEIVASGRTSSSGPNLQNREAKEGDRECFVPRRGNVFADIDYEGIELRTVAQIILHRHGWSSLAEALVSGKDPHSMMAAQILRITYDEAVRRKSDKTDSEFLNARQSSKIANFGFAGGMSAKVLVLQARAKYGVKLTLDEAEMLRREWLATWPEFNDYFRGISNECQMQGGYTTTEFYLSGRIRGWSSYTETANGYMQGLAADLLKEALWQLAKECYVGHGILRGCRPVNEVHDQIVTEAPEEIGHEVALAQQEIMEEAGRVWCPDLARAIAAPPMLARRMSKISQAVYKDGRLIPWEWPEAVKAGCPGHAQ